MSGRLWVIRGGRVIDPANGVDEVRDIWIDADRIVAPPADPESRPARLLDARGAVVMPGGIDVHCHIAGPKVNAARLMQPEISREAPPRPRRAGFRSGTGGVVPTSFTTGYRYAGLGYTFACDAAIAPLAARQAHHELADTPVIDKAFLILLGNDHFALERIGQGRASALRDYLAWMLGATRGYGVKVVNPGGIERWKQAQGTTSSLDDPVPGFDVTPRAILTEIARAVDELGLPHPVHIHGLNLGLPGNAASTLELMKALDGHRAHLAHIQFHSYAGDPSDQESMASGVEPLADYVNAHDHLSLDVGQILFGPTTSMTADSAVAEYLHRLTGRKWLSHDVELETGCGVVPIEYRHTQFIHALQWAIGLEWFLRVNDPWKLALSTDHPNGGSYLAYPRIIGWLMSRALRDEVWAALPAPARSRSALADLDREYTLAEIAIITRAAPARMLGLADRGHLGPGARADVTIYRDDPDRVRMFELPRWVIKSGQIVIDDSELRAAPDGLTLHNAPAHDDAIIPEIRDHFDRHASIRFAHFPLRSEEAP
ncbi:MAG: protein fwdA [Isosphaeraceae bacterium]|jgi:formylmethanofuran dehydrogenase subunit A|nr:MAG: protein fwdA [Isosphaeraceae bacterium]